jgi:prevent-host-death family protein
MLPVFGFDWRDRLVRRMTATIGAEDAQSSFPDLLARAIAGEEVVISSRGKPVARLAPVGKDLPARVPGTEKGKIFLACRAQRAPPAHRDLST